MLEILTLTGAQTRPYFGPIQEIYASAFKAPPFNEALADVLVFSARLPQHARWGGFKCVLAVDRVAGIDGNLAPGAGTPVGFAYGYVSRPDTWWRQQVDGAMSREMVLEWLQDCFEFVELAVSPAYQGRGAGGRLHDALLAGIKQRTAILSTPQANTKALHLYRKRGWVNLIENFVFQGVPLPYLIMGMRLKPDGQ